LQGAGGRGAGGGGAAGAVRGVGAVERRPPVPDALPLLRGLAPSRPTSATNPTTHPNTHPHTPPLPPSSSPQHRRATGGTAARVVVGSSKIDTIFGTDSESAVGRKSAWREGGRPPYLYWSRAHEQTKANLLQERFSKWRPPTETAKLGIFRRRLERCKVAVPTVSPATSRMCF
jgi:hypothetical protein